LGARITQQILVESVLADIRHAQTRLAHTLRTVSTGRRINAPSDDPVGTARALDLRTAVSSTNQFMVNVRDATAFATESESTLRAVIDSYHRVRELTVRGASGTLNQEQRDTIALEINQLLESVVDHANTESNNRYLFSGTRTRITPFQATRDPVSGEITAVSYAGNSERFSVQVSPGITVPVNEPGDSAFQDLQDTFQTLMDIRDDLRAGDTDSLSNVRLGEVDNVMTQLLDGAALFGAKMNRLELVEQRLEDRLLGFQEHLSDTEDADLVEAVVRMNTQQTALEAALNAGARVLQPSLLDFIA
jgi:flagellar hook-associated protein 3 FlgL